MSGIPPTIPTSWGEVIDKITILEIKSERLSEAGARANVTRELALLSAIEKPVAAQIGALKTRLRAINEILWETEDRIRDKERAGVFDAEFIALARMVYKTNDERAAIKKEINGVLKSELTEEKSYKAY